MIWVIDASVAIRWFLANETHPHADAVLRRLVDEPESFAVPELFCFEVYAVLCRLHPHGSAAFLQGMLPLVQNGLFRRPMTESLCRQAGLFITMGLTGYDACYAALAKEMDGIWITFDKKAHQCLAEEKVSHFLGDRLPESW
ncbi:MAG TPA: type II toxin-antitoxin system VapC family toxin [Thermodesulfobacteriota bacterium]|nr:type II toxin-antitoxin system VapC family toxin [Deltaproteobacteria bacterium]HNR14318.1 type II toxin-antitoxin system VapC family toxin [Thermodesulfobacteriota bacterium]HNU71930.1 type II toxin-antitoxin system VapC family toxin [Thermodesulfobacteriota bacterium]HOC38860.1 type II toxin-antitoxin system VapC family toxin [Thermodesulfobacteriota bacterium]HQO78783.1 type II toxin-antitoxin system VapC family toxin [Thermodesulfobacteriota bacterium]